MYMYMYMHTYSVIYSIGFVWTVRFRHRLNEVMHVAHHCTDASFAWTIIHVVQNRLTGLPVKLSIWTYTSLLS